MKKISNIFWGLILISACSYSDNTQVENDNIIKISSHAYFSPKIEKEIVRTGILKNKKPYGTWEYSLNAKDQFFLSWNELKYDRGSMILPDSFKLHANDKNKFYQFGHGQNNYKLYLKENLTDIDLSNNYIVDEVVGITQLCLEIDSCSYLEKVGNLFTFKDRKIISFYFLEDNAGMKNIHIGAMIMTNESLYYLSKKLPYISESQTIKNLEEFSVVLNYLTIGETNLVPNVTSLSKVDPLNWSF